MGACFEGREGRGAFLEGEAGSGDWRGRLDGCGESGVGRLRFPRVSWARARSPKESEEGLSGSGEDVVEFCDD